VVVGDGGDDQLVGAGRLPELLELVGDLRRDDLGDVERLGAPYRADCRLRLSSMVAKSSRPRSASVMTSAQ